MRAELYPLKRAFAISQKNHFLSSGSSRAHLARLFASSGFAEQSSLYPKNQPEVKNSF
jgi:hypothetical protein